jgi:acyl-CoA synthetase (AMP-forming)/AMP-acid ligase II
MNGVLEHGATLVTMPRFDLEQFLALIAGAQRDPGVRRAADRPRAREAPDGRRSVRPVDPQAGRVRCGPARRRPRAAATERIGTEVVQGYGLTETSPVTNLTPSARRSPGRSASSSRTSRCASSTPSPARTSGARRGGRDLVRGPNVMKGYLNPGRRTPARCSTPTAGCTPATSAGRRRRLPVDHRPPEGAHQVQGLPGPARRARGAAHHPPGDRRRRGHRHPRRGGRRAAEGLRRARPRQRAVRGRR